MDHGRRAAVYTLDGNGGEERREGAGLHAQLLLLCKRHFSGVLEKGDVLFTRRSIGISNAPVRQNLVFGYYYILSHILLALSISHLMHLSSQGYPHMILSMISHETRNAQVREHVSVKC